MNEESVLQELENISTKLGVIVRYELGDFIGGLCRIDNAKFIIVNKKLPISKKINVIAKEISSLDIEDVFILPVVKEIILKNAE